MSCKEYTKNDLLSKKYAIVEYSVEDGAYYIASLHDDYDKAQKRLKFLNKEAQRLFDKGIYSCGFGLYETNNEKVRKSFNYIRESE